MPAASGWQGRRRFGLSRPPDGRQVAAEAHGTGEGRPPLVLPADAITQEVTMSSTAPLADTAADLARSFAGRIPAAGRSGVRGGPVGAQRPYRRATGAHRPLPRPGRHRRALKVARDRRREVAVRGGGHNVAGRSTTDGGLVVDLSPMRGVHVGPRARTARAQGGVTGNGFNRETQRKRGEFGRRAPVV